MQDSTLFESRKRDHIELALQEQNQTADVSQLESITLVHEALPDINFQDISIETTLFGEKQSKPFFISSMTAGHADATALNMRLARVCQDYQWPMGVGSQRRQLFDHEARREWQMVRRVAPTAILFANLGIAQVISTSTKLVQELVDSLEASAMIVHLNALQECLQPEGTPQFAGGLKSIGRLVKELECPVIVKETGCGMSLETMKRLNDIGVHAIDVSGLGGTHWGRIEGRRGEIGKNNKISQAARVFSNWGISSVESILNSQKLTSKSRPDIWASGGLRSGLDTAKFFALGAKMAGFAKPALENAVKGEEALTEWMSLMEYELKIAMFCTGSQNLNEIKNKVSLHANR